MIFTQNDLFEKRNNIRLFYKIKDLQCESFVLSGFKNNINKDICYEKRIGYNQKITNPKGFWVWLDKRPNNIFWLSDKKLNTEFKILYCYSGISKTSL